MPAELPVGRLEPAAAQERAQGLLPHDAAQAEGDPGAEHGAADRREEAGLGAEDGSRGQIEQGRGTKAAAQTPYPAANSTTAVPTGSPGGQPSDSTRWGSNSSTHTPAATSSTTSSDSRVRGARRRDIPGD